jgi:hypothetical protein
LPFAPTNVQAKRLGEPNHRVVSVSWTPGFDGNSPILKYIVQRREVSEIEISGPLPDNLQNWITETSNISSSAKSVQIKNLKAATTYQFRVSAVNRVGEGYPSEPTNTISLPHEGEFDGGFGNLFRDPSDQTPCRFIANINSTFSLPQLHPAHQSPSWDQLDPPLKSSLNGNHHSKSTATAKSWATFSATSSTVTAQVHGPT